ncbi:MAG: sugar phosphate isomerase/epimerase family protein [Candidatus Poribacteria bacterium]
MKIAYGTYATPMMNLKDSLKMMADIGYTGVEIAISPKHIMPEEFGKSHRKDLRSIIDDLGFDVPGFLVLGSVIQSDSYYHQKRLDLIKRVVELARDIDIKRMPVISTGSGGNSENWENKKTDLAKLLEDYAEVGEQEDAIIAVEPHFHALVDRSERAIWLMETLDNPFIKLHFDIVHNFLMKEPIAETVKKLIPYTVHTHITDAKLLDDGFELVPLGQGELDCVEYVKAMKEARWDDFITIEVSAMVWSKEGYDPISVATISYETLIKAFESAGV